MFWEEVREGLVSAGPLCEGGWSEVPSDDVVYYGVQDVVAEGQVLELKVNWKERENYVSFQVKWSLNANYQGLFCKPCKFIVSRFGTFK